MTDALSLIPAADAPEEWRALDAYPGHSVSSHGRVRRDIPRYGGGGASRPPLECLATRALPQGHVQVTISISNKPITLLVHRLVALAFLPPAKEGQDRVLHADDDPSNNRPSNLRWGTAADNSADMVKRGRQARGVRVPSAKIDPDLVRQIRRASAAGQRQRDIAKSFGVAQSNVSLICSGRTWRHVQ